jgi:hypothetical protein
MLGNKDKLAAVNKLKNKMQGATVKKVEFVPLDESICRFTMSKKGKTYSFVLFATELGFWTSEEFKD